MFAEFGAGGGGWTAAEAAHRVHANLALRVAEWDAPGHCHCWEEAEQSLGGATSSQPMLLHLAFVHICWVPTKNVAIS
jgi:hypothetical protein